MIPSFVLFDAVRIGLDGLPITFLRSGPVKSPDPISYGGYLDGDYQVVPQRHS